MLLKMNFYDEQRGARNRWLEFGGLFPDPRGPFAGFFGVLELLEVCSCGFGK